MPQGNDSAHCSGFQSRRNTHALVGIIYGSSVRSASLCKCCVGQLTRVKSSAETVRSIVRQGYRLFFCLETANRKHRPKDLGCVSVGAINHSILVRTSSWTYITRVSGVLGVHLGKNLLLSCLVRCP
jgi:hypothetical protein